MVNFRVSKEALVCFKLLPWQSPGDTEGNNEDFNHDSLSPVEIGPTLREIPQHSLVGLASLPHP